VDVNVVTLIADIVGSRGISDRREFQRRLKAVLASINESRRASLLSPLTLTIGDEFQAVYRGFASLIPDLVEILAGIHPARLRAAASYGPLSTDINPHAALEMDGKAFNDARELMESLKTRRRTIIQITTGESFNPDLVNISLALFSNAAGGWKHTTTQILNLLFKKEPVEAIAAELHITPRAVNKNIAANNLRDCLELSRIIAAELQKGLKIDGRE
jgi:hypothetical protein